MCVFSLRRLTLRCVRPNAVSDLPLSAWVSNTYAQRGTGLPPGGSDRSEVAEGLDSSGDVTGVGFAKGSYCVRWGRPKRDPDTYRMPRSMLFIGVSDGVQTHTKTDSFGAPMRIG
jgi:hypothetical protein